MVRFCGRASGAWATPPWNIALLELCFPLRKHSLCLEDEQVPQNDAEAFPFNDPKILPRNAADINAHRHRIVRTQPHRRSQC